MGKAGCMSATMWPRLSWKLWIARHAKRKNMIEIDFSFAALNFRGATAGVGGAAVTPWTSVICALCGGH